MKVGELKKINQFINEDNYHFEGRYENLLNLKQEDIDLVIKKIENKNENAKVLVDFLCWELDNENWADEINKLKSDELFNVRQFIINEILTAESLELADAIYCYFGFECDGIINKMKSINEWVVAVKSIKANFEECEEIIQGNLNYALENFGFELNKDFRIELIKRVMEYSQSKNKNYIKSCSIDEIFDENFINSRFLDILDLLEKGYRNNLIGDFYKKWQSAIDESKQFASIGNNSPSIIVVNGNFEVVVQYLKNSKLFNLKGHIRKNSNYELIKLFLNIPYTNYVDVVDFLQDIEEKEYGSVFDLVLKFQMVDNEIMLRYYNSILNAPKTKEYDNYRIALFELDNSDYGDFINKNVINKTIYNIRIALDAIDLAYPFDTDVYYIAEFIRNVRIPEIISSMVINKENVEVRENVIYKEFPSMICETEISDELKNFYRSLLAKLSSLPCVEVCSRVIEIFKLDYVKNMSIEARQEILDTLIIPENYEALEYIKNQYMKMNDDYLDYKEARQVKPIIGEFDSSVKLATVVELLADGQDLGKVLDGFKDDEEITSKTLIRSLAYKNN